MFLGLCPWHVSLINIFLFPFDLIFSHHLSSALVLTIAKFGAWQDLVDLTIQLYTRPFHLDVSGILNSTHLRFNCFSISSKLFFCFSLTVGNTSFCPKTESCFRKWWIPTLVFVGDTNHPSDYLAQKLRLRFTRHWSGTQSMTEGRYAVVVK